jgi:hypothetical protein
MISNDLVLVDELPRQLNGQGIIALSVLRNHGELPPTDTTGGVDLFDGDFSGGTALHTVAGTLFGQRHHNTHDDLIAKGMREPWQHQEHYQATTQEHVRFFHYISSSL